MSLSGGFSFGSRNRINDKAGFSSVFAKPKYTKRHDCCSVFAIHTGLRHARLGIVVAKKNVRLAVQRSRIKRKIREAFRLQQSDLSGYDIVVVVKKDFASLPGNFLATIVQGQGQGRN